MPVKIVLVILNKDVSIQMTRTVVIAIVNATPMHAMTRLVALPLPLTVMTTTTVPPTHATMIKDVFTLQFSVANLMSAILMVVTTRLVVLKRLLIVTTTMLAPLMTATPSQGVPTSQ